MKTEEEINKEIERIYDLLDRKSTNKEMRIMLNAKLVALFWVLEVSVALANRPPIKE